MNNWIEVTIKTTTEAVEPITNILYEQGAGGAVIEDPKDFLFQRKMNQTGIMLKKKYLKRMKKMMFL